MKEPLEPNMKGYKEPASIKEINDIIASIYSGWLCETWAKEVEGLVPWYLVEPVIKRIP